MFKNSYLKLAYLYIIREYPTVSKELIKEFQELEYYAKIGRATENLLQEHNMFIKGNYAEIKIKNIKDLLEIKDITVDKIEKDGLFKILQNKKC